MITHLQISTNGRIIIPKRIREILGIRPGGMLVANLLGNSLQITSAQNSVKHAQNLVKKYCIDNDINLADDLLTMRRKEVAQEENTADIVINSDD